MTYPTAGAYQEALQFPRTAFTDPELQEAEFEVTALGLPRAISGAFAVVFPMQARAAHWAVKCFVTEAGDLHARYRAVARHLGEVDLDYAVPFEYQPEGIQVGGEMYPVLKMAWIDALPLNRYVERHLDDRDALESVIRAWREMADALEKAGVAHGDLQHGNVLIDGDGALKLVDYDAMVVPSLQGRRSPEVGHRNYQHPDRDERHSGPYLDRFAELAIDTGLRACIHEPALWERFDDGENILFRSGDLAAPDASPLFDALRAIEPISDQVEALRRACYLEPEDVPPLSVVTSDAAAMPSTGRKRPQKDAFERYLYPVAAAILLVVAIVQVADSAGLVLVAALAVGFVAWMAVRYRALPPVRRRRRLEKEDAYFERLLAALHGELQRLEQRRRDVVTSHEGRREERLAELRREALHHHLKHHFIGDALAFEGISHKVVVRLKASGIRTAAHATPERVRAIVQMSDESKARVELWRAALVAQYRDEMPDALSPAEARRLERGLARELEALDAEIVRQRRKIEIQEEEHAGILARKADLDVPSFLRFVLSMARAT